jgi:hypothetical protein
MRRVLLIIAIGVFVASLAATPATGADKAVVVKELTALQKQMLEMQKQMEALEAQLEVSRQNAAAAQHQAQQTTQVVDQKMAEVSGKFKKLDDLAAKFKKLKLSGAIRTRWWEGDHEQNSFDVYEIQFCLRYDVSENISGQFEMRWHPSGNMAGRAEYANYSNAGGDTTSVENAFAEFRNLNIGPVEGKLLVGKLRNQAFGIVPNHNDAGRVTADNGLFHDSNDAARITGLQYLTKWQDFEWNFAVFNGYALQGDSSRFGAKPAGIRQIRYSQMDLDDNNHKAFSTKLWYKPSADPFKGLQVGYSYFHQKLSDNDLANFNLIMGRNAGMQGNFFGDPTHAKSDIRTGPSLTYDKGPFALKTEYFLGTVADVDMNWWYVTLGYKMKELRTEFWLRYSQANYDQKTIRDIRASGAWDKAQWTPCIIYHLHPMADLYFEYYFNDVDKPSDAHMLTNNYGFIELIVKY